MNDWSKRIPAAIANGKAYLEDICPCSRTECRADRGDLTAGEVALAEALWEHWSDEWGDHTTCLAGNISALQDFTEKIESLLDLCIAKHAAEDLQEKYG